MTTLCKNCVSGYVLPGEPKGTIKDGAYIYSYEPDGHPQDGTPNLSGKTAIILLTDIFGLDLKNSKILADSFGDRLQCDVHVPDLFNGYPPFSEADLAPYAPDVPGEKLSWIELLKSGMVWIRAAPSLWSSRPAVGLIRAETYINKIKAKQLYAKLGVVGYCYGGGLSLILSTREGLVDVVVTCHGAPVDVAGLSDVKTPLMMACAEEDQWLSPARRDQAEARLKGNTTIDSKFMLYPGTVHGFAARPNLAIPQVKEMFEKVFEDAVDWLASHLQALYTSGQP